MLLLIALPFNRFAQQEKSAKPEDKKIEAKDHYVVMISIDGMSADYYIKADRNGSKIPNMRRLLREGAYAEGSETIYPSLTYPAHTTMITGVKPAKHGIYSNRLWQPPVTRSSEWHWYAKDIKVPTLWSEAHKAGLTTAAVAWPVTVGAEIDYLIPEIWEGSYATSFRTSFRNASPGLIAKLFDQVPENETIFTDDLRTRATIEIIKKFHPNLTLLHLSDLDYQEHRSGPFSKDALEQLEQADAHIGQVIQAIKDAGIAEKTTLLVVSDHGFLPIEKIYYPTSLLIKNGYITLNKDGSLKDWQALPYGDGGSTAIMMKDANDRILEYKLVELFEKASQKANSPIAKVFKREELTKMGTNPDATLMLEAAQGYEINSDISKDQFAASGDFKGSHGYIPSRPELYASFIIYGRGVLAGAHDPYTQNIHVAPTIAALLGFTLPEVDGKPIRSLITVAVPKITKPKAASTSAGVK